MASPYFKARRPFDFRPHPYEIGNILGAKKGFEDNHFLAKVYDLDTGHSGLFTIFTYGTSKILPREQKPSILGISGNSSKDV